MFQSVNIDTQLYTRLHKQFTGCEIRPGQLSGTSRAQTSKIVKTYSGLVVYKTDYQLARTIMPSEFIKGRLCHRGLLHKTLSDSKKL